MLSMIFLVRCDGLLPHRFDDGDIKLLPVCPEDTTGISPEDVISHAKAGGWATPSHPERKDARFYCPAHADQAKP